MPIGAILGAVSSGLGIAKDLKAAKDEKKAKKEEQAPPPSQAKANEVTIDKNDLVAAMKKSREEGRAEAAKVLPGQSLPIIG